MALEDRIFGSATKEGMNQEVPKLQTYTTKRQDLEVKIITIKYLCEFIS